ncbi:hypothetical protein AC579_1850 [Pseudocercospora musae]|uniref:Secreted protein n=1 Tax=Pseudocercospora musae TaxID=113226 RepID=A0A139GX26_9PEZI|nr:hypothetical protein AC579_1850 [Pseudocercospora musae]
MLWPFTLHSLLDFCLLSDARLTWSWTSGRETGGAVESSIGSGCGMKVQRERRVAVDTLIGSVYEWLRNRVLALYVVVCNAASNTTSFFLTLANIWNISLHIRDDVCYSYSEKASSWIAAIC